MPCCTRAASNFVLSLVGTRDISVFGRVSVRVGVVKVVVVSSLVDVVEAPSHTKIHKLEMHQSGTRYEVTLLQTLGEIIDLDAHAVVGAQVGTGAQAEVMTVWTDVLMLRRVS